MKHIIRRIIPIVLLLGGTLTGCNNPANNETHYVRLSDAACTFRHTDNTPFTIEVITSPDNWEARSSGSWLQAERQGTALVLTPEENLTGAERSTEVTVTAGQATARIQVTQLGDTTLPIIYRKARRPPFVGHLARRQHRGRILLHGRRRKLLENDGGLHRPAHGRTDRIRPLSGEPDTAYLRKPA